MNRVCLIILDGWGYAPEWGGNPIALARPAAFNALWRGWPHALLEASGKQVGLPGHEAGNSEVGHLNLGAGRVVQLDQTAITQTIKDGSFFLNEILLEAFHRAHKLNGAVHIMGLVSEGGVHSSLDHIYALLELASRQQVDRFFLHIFTDGRDCPPQSALGVLEKIDQAIALYKVGEYATVSGRFFAMDRDHNLERTQKAVDAIARAVGPRYDSAKQAVAASYKQGLSDEYIIPSVVTRSHGEPVALVLPQDSVIFFNFRADRSRQITDMLLARMPNLYLVTFVPYQLVERRAASAKPAFTPQVVSHPLAQVLSQVGVNQFHIAETEKYAHITYFLNGGVEEPFPGEGRLLVPSVKVFSFSQAPQMAAPEITDELIKRLRKRRIGFFAANFANADMVGHTGDVSAAIKAVQALDIGLSQIFDACRKEGIYLIITADHGNIEEIINPATGQVDTKHSTNPVPFILVAPDNSPFFGAPLRPTGILADVAPTILEIMAINKPSQMTGTSLLAKI